MAYKKKTKVKGSQVKEQESDLDYFHLFQKHKKVIIYSVAGALLIVILCIFYNIYASNLENESWYNLTDFVQNHPNHEDVNQADILELLSKTKGTSAEPWVKYHSLSIYINKYDLENASKLLNDLENDYNDHYISKNHAFLESMKNVLSKEREWANAKADSP